MELIDITIPAVRRPEVLARCLDSLIVNVLHDTSQFRLLINIDPVGPGTVDEVLAVCRARFDNLVYNAPEDAGSLNRALMWLWRTADSDLILYTEDDIEIIRPVDLADMMAVLRRREKCAFLQMPHVPLPTSTFAATKTLTQSYSGGRFWLRGGPYKMALQPALLRWNFARCASLMLRDNPDPEIQFHRGNPTLGAFVDEWTFGTYGEPGDSIACSDIGGTQRGRGGYCKFVGEVGTAWYPVRQADIHGIKVPVIDHACGRTTWDALDKGHYLHSTYHVIDRFLRPNDIFIDVGAYVGAFALYAARICREVWAFEPDPKAYAILAKNVNMSRCAGLVPERLRVAQKAIGAGLGMVKLGGALGSSLPSLSLGMLPGAIDVEVCTLGNAMKRWSIPGCDFLKITVQGYEGTLLEAARDVIEQYKPTMNIYAHPRQAKSPAETVGKMVDVLKLYKHVTDDAGRPMDLDALLSPEQLARRNYMVVASDRPWEVSDESP